MKAERKRRRLKDRQRATENEKERIKTREGRNSMKRRNKWVHERTRVTMIQRNTEGEATSIIKMNNMQVCTNMYVYIYVYIHKYMYKYVYVCGVWG